jgi:Uma2 family endonuclease
MNPNLLPLVKAGNLPDLLAQLNQYFADEQKMRDEFHEWLTPEIKAEFINGELVLHSPALARHTRVVVRLTQILQTYTVKEALGSLFIEKALVRMPRNSYEPDLIFYRKEVADTFSDDLMLFPVPDWIAEVLSPSTEGRDRGVKQEDYARNGVQEYWIIDPLTETVEVLIAENHTWHRQTTYTEGIIRSSVFAGLDLPVRAVFEDREAQGVMRQILK